MEFSVSKSVIKPKDM